MKENQIIQAEIAIHIDRKHSGEQVLESVFEVFVNVGFLLENWLNLE